MNVVNFGSLNLDHVYAVDHFCRAGETIHTAGYTQNAGGKGLNQSIAVARSGQALCHAGMLGAGGEPLAQLLEGCGVDLRYLGRTETPQGHAIIQVQPDGQNCIFLYGGSNQAVTPEDIDAVLSHFAPGDYLLMQNELSNFTYLLRAAVGRGLRVVLNASPISGEVLAADLTGVDWLVVNEIECAAIAGCSTAGGGLCRAAGALSRARHSADARVRRIRQLEGRRGDPAVRVSGPGGRHDRRGRYVHGVFCRLSGAGHGAEGRHAVCGHGRLHRRYPPRRCPLHPHDGRSPRGSGGPLSHTKGSPSRGAGSAQPRLRGCCRFATARCLRRPLLFRLAGKEGGEKGRWVTVGCVLPLNSGRNRCFGYRSTR